jgi:MOSC domain-containing protein YiiM
MIGAHYLTILELEAGLELIRQSPGDEGVLELIVRRPAVGDREVLDSAELHNSHGLAGDRWKPGRSGRETQLTLMNSRAIALLAQTKDRWPLAGDQLYVDFDLSVDYLPPGSRLSIGDAVIEISGTPHTGCQKFAARFGLDAVKFVNSPAGKQLRLRGANAKVVHPGMVRVGDAVRKLTAANPAT